MVCCIAIEGWGWGSTIWLFRVFSAHRACAAPGWGLSVIDEFVSLVNPVSWCAFPSRGNPDGVVYTQMRWVQAPHSLVFTSHSSMHRFYLSPHSRPQGQRLAEGAALLTSSRSRRARRFAGRVIDTI